MFEETLVCTINRLKVELESDKCDNSFISFLEGIGWDNIFN